LGSSESNLQQSSNSEIEAAQVHKSEIASSASVLSALVSKYLFNAKLEYYLDSHL